MKFPESPMAHYYLDGLKGIEIGGSEHNAFNIPGCLNVDCNSTNAHKMREIELCGRSLPVDVISEGDKLPFDDNAWDFVLNSHVIEHMPDPIGCIKEWIRVVRDGGYIFFVVPIRDMNPDDRRYPYTTRERIKESHRRKDTVETAPFHEGQGPRGHYWHWTPMRFAHFIGWAFGDELELTDSVEHDDKVGNGCTFVAKVIKPAGSASSPATVGPTPV